MYVRIADCGCWLKGKIEKALPSRGKKPGQMFSINLSKLILREEMTMKGVQ